MTILNRANDGLVSVLIALVRLNAKIGTMQKEKLLDICSPKSLGNGQQEMARKTLDRWIELGLFVVSDNGNVKIVDEQRTKLRKTNASRESIGSVTREIILAKHNNINFWNKEKNLAADFTRAVSWMLAQDIHEFAPTVWDDVESISHTQVTSDEYVIFQNDTRWLGFVSWATFLGFGRPDSGKTSGRFITDPTPVVAGAVENVLPKKKEIAVKDLLAELSELVPVLDGGVYRKEVENILRPERWTVPGVADISTSLSRALLRLEAQGKLRLEERSDSDAQVQLLGRDRKKIRDVTHVRRGDK